MRGRAPSPQGDMSHVSALGPSGPCSCFYLVLFWGLRRKAQSRPHLLVEPAGYVLFWALMCELRRYPMLSPASLRKQISVQRWGPSVSSLAASEAFKMATVYVPACQTCVTLNARLHQVRALWHRSASGINIKHEY